MPTYPNQPNNKPIFHDFTTPVGLVSRLYHDEPMLKTNYQTKQPEFDKDGVQLADFKLSLVFPKAIGEMEMHPTIPGSPGLLPVRRLAYQTGCEAWPELANEATAKWIVLEPFLMDGDNPQHNTERKEFLFGHYWMNLKCKATPKRMQPTAQHPQGQVVYDGKPGLLGPYGVNGPELHHTDIWPGCKARASGVMWGTEYAGKKFIKLKLNNIQMYEPGERMFGNVRPSAASQFDPLIAGQPPIGAMGDPAGGPQGGFPAQGGFQPQQGGFPQQGQPMVDPFAAGGMGQQFPTQQGVQQGYQPQQGYPQQPQQGHGFQQPQQGGFVPGRGY